jgi:c-di-GMP-binding flagellar brake protein YcgR
MELTYDRRLYPRISLHHVTVEVYPGGTISWSTPQLCLIVNMSETGMQFKSEHCIAEQNPVYLTFILTHNYIIINTQAVVVHCKESGTEWCVGVQFTKIEKSDRNLIREFIASAQ